MRRTKQNPSNPIARALLKEIRVLDKRLKLARGPYLDRLLDEKFELLMIYIAAREGRIN